MNERQRFRLEIDECMVCGQEYRKRFPARLEVHEMARGVHRKEAVKHRFCWLLVCPKHHEEMGNYGKWPLAKQLALKYVKDNHYFHLVDFNLLRGRAENAITWEEVFRYIDKVLA